MADLPTADGVLGNRGVGARRENNDVVDLAGSDDSSLEVVESRQRAPSPVESSRPSAPGQSAASAGSLGASASHPQAMRERAREEAARAFSAAAAPPTPAVAAVAAELIPRDGTCGPAPANPEADDPSSPPPARAAAESRTRPPTPAPPAAVERPAAHAPAAGFVTVWTCDVCRAAQFESFDAAVEHERTCGGIPPAGDPPAADAGGALDGGGAAAGGAPAAVPAPPPSRPREVFYQILRDSNDTPCFSRISPFHRTVLRSASLWSVPAAGGGGGRDEGGGGGDPARFSCRFCGEAFPTTRIAADGSGYWSLADLTADTYSSNPNNVYSKAERHLLNACEGTPGEIDKRLPKMKKKGKMALSEFVPGYLEENGVVEVRGRLLVMSDEEFRKLPGTANTKRGKQLLSAASGKKRGRSPANPDGKANKRQPKPSATDKKSVPPSTARGRIRRGDMGCSGHIVDECVARLAPLDGLPLMCSFTSEAAGEAGLTDAQRLLLNHVELFVLPPGPSGAGEGAVGLRDRNTLASASGCVHVRLESVGSLGDDVLLLNSEHLVSCRLVKGRESRTLQGLVGGDNVNLVLYCRYVAEVYSMVDRDGFVAFDDSPEVPGEYVTPDDVDAVAILDRPMPGLEVEAPDAPPQEETPAPSGTLTLPPRALGTAPAEKMATAVRLEKPIGSQLVALPRAPDKIDAAAVGAGASSGPKLTTDGVPSDYGKWWLSSDPRAYSPNPSEPLPDGDVFKGLLEKYWKPNKPPSGRVGKSVMRAALNKEKKRRQRMMAKAFHDYRRALPQDAPRACAPAIGKADETAPVESQDSSAVYPPARAPPQDAPISVPGARGHIASSPADEVDTRHCDTKAWSAA